MNWFGLSPAVLGLGAVALVAGIAALHLLRVRLRTVEVDTLLFFRLAGAVQRPRVLPGRPARLLAFLLALLAALAAWSGLGAPRIDSSAASRLVVVEPDLGSAGARLAAAQRLVAAGLGPRGAVVAATLPPQVLWSAGEPFEALATRHAVLEVPPSGLGAATALQAAQARCRGDDEVVWLGHAVPPSARSVTVVPVAAAVPFVLRHLRWQRQPDGAYVLSLAVQAAPGAPRPLAVRAAGEELAAGVLSAGCGEIALGPFALPKGITAVECAVAGAAPLSVPVPELPPVRVFADGLPADVQAALWAVVAGDVGLQRAAQASEAEVVVAAADDPADPRPRLVVSAGTGAAALQAIPTAEAPVSLSLRDRRSEGAPTLVARSGAVAWCIDAASGAPLVQAAAAPAPRVEVVAWLLQPATHADVPVLLATALHGLAGRPNAQVAGRGQPLRVPAVLPVAAARGAILPAEGSLPRHLVEAATTAQAPLGPVLSAAPVVDPTARPPELAPRGGDGALAGWLFGLFLLLLLVDALLFHRGRMP
ncbi:MAG: hypothetical protein JNK49_11195 [Planctomycetes bacterium]|nr:hypothetical protein [Planctomycetota bacterium]